VSHVHRLQTSDRIFFITVNLGRALPPLAGEEYGLLVDAVAESRQKLHFLLYGYVLMPEHWHALIWTTYPLTISRVVQDIKWAGGPRFGGERVPHPWRVGHALGVRGCPILAVCARVGYGRS
jgi:REP element-mobilizing transposase RayT